MTASPTDNLASAERRIQELTKELSQARGELLEARQQQAATAEILRVISSSPMDLQRVFAEIAASAARLCDAYDVVILGRTATYSGSSPTMGRFPCPARWACVEIFKDVLCSIGERFRSPMHRPKLVSIR